MKRGNALLSESTEEKKKGMVTLENPLKEVYDRSSLLKDISERNQLLQDYQRTGWLDRDKAIRKIRELRATDIKVATAAAMTPARNQIPFDQASDQMIANELQGQLEYLVMKAANQES